MSSTRENGIDPGVSSFLDLSRLLAALAVAMSHFLPNLFGIDPIPGHDAVIVFFVISGYVIAFAAEQRDRSFGQFALNRLARLWSVLLPSLLLSAVVAVWIGERGTMQFAPAIVEPGAFLSAAVKHALFLGETWDISVEAPFNVPAWSVSFEAWYYAIFAAWMFTPHRWRFGAVAVTAALAGPAILALMPGWLLGLWLFKRGRFLRLRPALAYALFVGCALAYATVFYTDLGPMTRRWLMDLTNGHAYHLRASTRFLSDALNAGLFGAMILSVQSMPLVGGALARVRGFSRAMSSKTFSLYLFHMPLLVLAHDGLGWGGGSVAGSLGCMAAVLGGCVLLGFGTEAKLPAWRCGLAGVWALGAKLAPAPGRRAYRDRAENALG